MCERDRASSVAPMTVPRRAATALATLAACALTATGAFAAGAVEALKILTEVLFEHAGRIVAIGAEEGNGVEYAQPLFTLESID